MIVLSLFDGMSCGQIAFNRIGIKPEKYYASEIDKYAIKITQKNYPDTIQLGDVIYLANMLSVFPDTLGKIDLIMAGFPCQPYSIAGKREGLKDKRGGNIVDAMISIIEILKPENVLLENVKGFKSIDKGRTFKLFIKKLNDIGYAVDWKIINSNKVSAQNRERIYFICRRLDKCHAFTYCLWKMEKIITWDSCIQQPEDKHISILDILEDKGTPVIQSHGFYKIRAEKSMCIDANYWKGKDNHGQRTIIINELGKADLNGHDFIKRVYDVNGKCPTLTAVCGGNQERKIAIDDINWRKLTPIECERLQTVPDNYTSGVSDSQRYKMLGNGWTVDVICHILNNMDLS